MSYPQQPPAPDPSQGPPPPPPKKSGKWKVVVGVVGAVIILALIGQCYGGDDTATPGASPSAVPTSAPPSSAAPQPSVPASSAPAEPEQDPQEWAEEMGDELLQAVQPGAESFQDTCPGNEWVCPIAKVHANVVGELHVVEQVDGLDEATAEIWAQRVFNMIGPDNPELEWVIIEDGTETVVGQRNRSSVPNMDG